DFLEIISNRIRREIKITGYESWNNATIVEIKDILVSPKTAESPRERSGVHDRLKISKMYLPNIIAVPTTRKEAIIPCAERSNLINKVIRVGCANLSISSKINTSGEVFVSVMA
ncbi:MAG: hypothetical protein HQK81_14510, partial [Desulfovibrionaceae bacterium]|nr:hypothetical protein [Desulfovibrionaceae bacterium]